MRLTVTCVISAYEQGRNRLVETVSSGKILGCVTASPKGDTLFRVVVNIGTTTAVEAGRRGLSSPMAG